MSEAFPTRSSGRSLGRWLSLHSLVTALAVLGLALALLLATPFVVWCSQAFARPWLEGDTGTLIVLDTAAPPREFLAESAYWRSVYAVRAWRSAHFDRVLVVGTPSLRDVPVYLRAHGIAEDRIQFLASSTDTHDAVLAILRIAPDLPKPLVLSTSDYHIYRATAAFRAAGLPVIPAPFPDGIKRGQTSTFFRRLTVFAILIEESLLIARYRYHGWI